MPPSQDNSYAYANIPKYVLKIHLEAHTSRQTHTLVSYQGLNLLPGELTHPRFSCSPTRQRSDRPKTESRDKIANAFQAQHLLPTLPARLSISPQGKLWGPVSGVWSMSHSVTSKVRVRVRAPEPQQVSLSHLFSVGQINRQEIVKSRGRCSQHLLDAGQSLGNIFLVLWGSFLFF